MTANLNSKMGTIDLGQMLDSYTQLQEHVMNEVTAASQNVTSASPGQFLKLQFMMSTVTQTGQSISNLIAQVQSMISVAVRNQRSS